MNNGLGWLYSPPFSGRPAKPEGPAPPNDESLEDLLHQKSEILDRKLEILAAEIRWRLHVGVQNLASLASDRARLQEMLSRLDVAARYHVREHQEKGVLYRKLFDLETETRSQQVECWRDVVLVMRDFLLAWETHEQTKARARFINDVGTGTQEPL